MGWGLAVFFTPDVNISAFAQHVQRHTRKNHKSDRNFPHINPIIKKALTKEGLLRRVGAKRLSLVVGVDIDVFGFADEKHADDKSHSRDDDRVPQTAVNIALRRHN